MAKRSVDSDDESPHRKRQKLTQNTAGPSKPRTVHELQALLKYDEDVNLEAQISAIKTFQSFLDSVRPKDDGNEQAVEKNVLLEYCRSQIPDEDTSDEGSVPDIIKVWHHALSVNSENLFSSTASVVASLLKTISALHEFRHIGNGLCKIILQEANITLIQHGLAANTHKEHLISPTLRLLKEIVLFDGGISAKTIYRLRHITFQRLDVFLGMRHRAENDRHGTRRRPAVRNLAIGYLIANLRLQSQVAKCYLLSQYRTVRSLFQELENDPPALVLTVLDVFKRDVVQDANIPLHVKGQVFNDWSLNRLTVLYGYNHPEYVENQTASIRDATHSLLLSVCTCSIQSRANTGESKSDYAHQYQKDRIDSEDEELNSRKGAQAKEHLRLQRSVENFLRNLRPYADNMQQDLLLACFQSCPQLMDDHFTGKAKFSFDPKLTATWIGYSNFMLAFIQRPLPQDLIRPTIYSDETLQRISCFILPPPLDRQVLTRCLNQSSSLMTFLTTRILIAAFEKLLSVTEILRNSLPDDPVDSTFSSRQTLSKFTHQLCERFPVIKWVVAQLKACSVQNTIMYESITRLLELYHIAAPQLALDGGSDVSPMLSTTLAGLQDDNSEIDKRGISSLTLDHMVSIARQSPSMRWWHKPDSVPLSPFTMLLRLHLQTPQHERTAQLTATLRSVLEEEYILWQGPPSPASAFDILVLSLDHDMTGQADQVLAFLDNCFLRITRKAEYYSERFEGLKDSKESGAERLGPEMDLLYIAASEQLTYLTETSTQEVTIAVARWFRRSIDLAMLRGVDKALLKRLRDQLAEALPDSKYRSIILRAMQEIDTDLCQEFQELISIGRDQPSSIEQAPLSVNNEASTGVDIPPGPPSEDQNHRGLLKWSREDIQDAIADGAVAQLILCLCSEHREIRTQALAQVQNFLAKLEPSGYGEWLQTKLLVGEVAETARTMAEDQPLPYIAGVLASRLLVILADPLHFLYEKTNIFLNKSPQWTVERLPSYWVDKILMQPPDDTESHVEELSWLLDLLTDGLRTPQDMDLYRRCHILERLLTTTASEHLSMIFDLVVDLLFRCTYVGGSTTLITRCGLESWIEIRLVKSKIHETQMTKLECLRNRAYETCDHARVETWRQHGSLAVDTYPKASDE